MSQLSLFETRAPPKQEGKPPRFRVPLECHPVKLPYGMPDKRGMHGYEKLRHEIDKLPVLYRERFNDLTIELPEETGNQFLKCLRMFMKLGNAELMDFDESRGRL